MISTLVDFVASLPTLKMTGGRVRTPIWDVESSIARTAWRDGAIYVSTILLPSALRSYNGAVDWYETMVFVHADRRTARTEHYQRRAATRAAALLEHETACAWVRDHVLADDET